MEIKHIDINKYIKKFVTSKQGNASFLLTSTAKNEVQVSIQGITDSNVLGNMLLTFLCSMPDVLPVFENAILYAKVAMEEVAKKEESLSQI